jgi:hypothetical protein
MATDTGSLMDYVLIYGQRQSYVITPHHLDILSFVFQAWGNTNIKVLPLLKHFSDNKKLCLPQTSGLALPPISGSTSVNPVDPMALLQQILQQNAAMTMFSSTLNPLAFASALPSGLTMAPSASQSATSSPSNAVTLSRPISIKEFCSYYNISDSDQLKLVTLEVHLGDCIVERLEREYWKEAGFSKLSWDHFLATHKQFVKDVRNGIWG